MAKKFSELLVSLYIVTSLLAGTQIYNKIIFVIALLFFLIIFLSKKHFFEIKYKIQLLLILLIHVYGSIVGIAGKNLSVETRQFFLAPSILMLVPLCLYFQINFEKLLYRAGIILTICQNLLILFFLGGYYEIILLLGKVLDIATGSRAFGDLYVPIVQFGTTPILFVIFSLCCMYLLKEKKIIDLACFFLLVNCIVFGGQRSLIIFSIIAILVAPQIYGSKRLKFFSYCLLLFSSYLYLQFYGLSSFDISEESNSIKIEHYKSFVENINIFDLLFGSGLGSNYYTAGYGRYASVTEITLLDSVRYFGLPMALLLFIIFLMPTLKMVIFHKEILFYFIIALMFVMYSLTNPVLYNSSGFLVIVLYWWKIGTLRIKES